MPALAIILGASISGLLAARALAPYFEQILLVERDCLADKPELRAGTAQARHAHILLQRGLIGFERMLPGFTQQLLDAGGVMTSATQDWYCLFPMGAFPQFESDMDFLCASRPQIEYTLRATLLRQHASITIRDGCRVTGIELSTAALPTVALQPSRENKASETIAADLVVDATGRNSQAPQWLRQKGFADTRQTMVKPYLGYATRLYKNVNLPAGIRATLVMAKDPDMTRGGVLIPIENDQYICTLYGLSGDRPPTEEAKFLEFAKGLRSDIIYKAIIDAEAQTPAKAFIKNECAYRHYAEKGIWPRGFLAVGDAVCSFNPIYAQGMTAALLAGESLAREFRNGYRTNAGWAGKVQRNIVKAYRAAWTLSTNEDLRWPGTEGAKKSYRLRSMHRFSDLVGKAATRNQGVAYNYLKVLHMSATPNALLKPLLFARILKAGLTYCA